MTWKDIIIAILDVIFKTNPSPPPTPQPTPIPGDFAAQLLTLHNNYRANMGLQSLILNDKLASAAQKHTQWMYLNNTLDHNENGKNPGQRMQAEGYDWFTYGENIAMGYADPQAVFNGWITSPGHRANIENSRFRDVGFGNMGKYWTADFGSTLMSDTGVNMLAGGLWSE